MQPPGIINAVRVPARAAFSSHREMVNALSTLLFNDYNGAAVCGRSGHRLDGIPIGAKSSCRPPDQMARHGRPIQPSTVDRGRIVTPWSRPVPPVPPPDHSHGPRRHASRHHSSYGSSSSSVHQDLRNRSRNTRSPSISAGGGGLTLPGPIGCLPSKSTVERGCPAGAGTPGAQGSQRITTSSIGPRCWAGGCCDSRHGTWLMGRHWLTLPRHLGISRVRGTTRSQHLVERAGRADEPAPRPPSPPWVAFPGAPNGGGTSRGPLD